MPYQFINGVNYLSKSYTTDDISKLLQVSKLTVYDIIKRGELPAYRVGRQMRIDSLDFERYKSRGKQISQANIPQDQQMLSPVVISGQDNSLDILARALEKRMVNRRPLRSYAGSLDSLIAMYNGEADIVSVHLLDGDTGEYNIPYVRKILVSSQFIVFRFIERVAGLYVAKGNPKNIKTWTDLANSSIVLTNREKGAGARVLLDEQLRMNGINKMDINGYNDEKTSHLAVASAISDDRADVGVGIEQVATIANIDFLPMVTERYDLVMIKTYENMELLREVQTILRSDKLQQELKTLGYNVENMGEVIWEE